MSPRPLANLFGAALVTAALFGCEGRSPSVSATLAAPARSASIPTESIWKESASFAPEATDTTPNVLLEGRALLVALQHGGYVLYFRHAITDHTQADRDVQDLSTCSAQRNLNDPGRSDAELIGQAIQALNIPIGDVLSSEFCRTRETAELVFGRATTTPDLTSLPSALDPAERDRRVEALRHLLSLVPQAGTNTALVSHLFNIQAAANVSLAEGEAAVFEPRGDEGFELVGLIRPIEWFDLLLAVEPL